MEGTSRKGCRKTTFSQFQKLVGLMGQYPHLATGIPLFGVSRADIENTWDAVTTIVNAIGPPERSKNEWKKIWADMKFRTKKTVSENNKRIRDAGGEDNCRLRTLTPLEFEIDRICHFSSPAPERYGEVNGVANDIKKMSKTATTQNIPAEKQSPDKATSLELSETISTAKRTRTTFAESEYQPKNIHSTRRTFQQKKKLYNEKNNDKNEQMRLLRQQIHMQQSMLDTMKLQAESAEASAEALQDIAESTKTMANAMMAVAKHFTGVNCTP